VSGVRLSPGPSSLCLGRWIPRAQILHPHLDMRSGDASEVGTLYGNAARSERGRRINRCPYRDWATPRRWDKLAQRMGRTWGKNSREDQPAIGASSHALQRARTSNPNPKPQKCNVTSCNRSLPHFSAGLVRGRIATSVAAPNSRKEAWLNPSFRRIRFDILESRATSSQGFLSVWWWCTADQARSRF
jgi:hypothetical protein